MALSLCVPTPFGANVVATYQRIGGAQVHYSDKCLDVTLFSYADHASREANAQPLGTIQERLTFDQCAATTEPTRTQIYEALKALAKFSGAADV